MLYDSISCDVASQTLPDTERDKRRDCDVAVVWVYCLCATVLQRRATNKYGRQQGKLLARIFKIAFFTSNFVWIIVGKETTMRGKGRHDPCVLPRAVPMVESMVALVLVDALMQHQAQCQLFPQAANLKSTAGSSHACVENPFGKRLDGFAGPWGV